MRSLNLLGLETWRRASSEGVLVTNATNQVEDANPRLKELLHLDYDPATVQDLLAATRASMPELASILDFDPAPRAARWGSVLVHGSVPVRLRWEQMPLFDGGEPVGVCTVFRDVTAQAERDLSKQSFLAMISHDLRTPLSAILGFSELLRSNRDALPAEVQEELLDSIVRNATDLNRFTQVALDVMYLEANVETFETEAVALDRFMRQWLADAAHRFPAEQLIFRNGVSPAYPARIAPSALHRILQILVEFALAESPTGSPVHLSLDYNSVRAHIRVRHEAPNLTHQDASTLFELFRPRDISERSRPQLHRIQMHVANLLAERQRGLLTLHEEPQAFFQFDLALPLDVAAGW